MVNVLSIDVEEYFHAANLFEVAGPRKWAALPSTVVPATNEILEVLAQHSVKATFFVLGYCARRHPQMVRDIVEQGHELASHGYGHRIAYTQTPKQFLRDVSISKKLLEDLSGVEVRGYRAPNFSITPRNPWGYNCLVEAGYLYDSSTYPIWHPRYANRAESLEPTCLLIEGKRLFRFPLAVASLNLFGKEYRFPVAGGAYWRLLPKTYNVWGMRSINNKDRWFATYLHPWELDTRQPKFDELPLARRIRHYGNVDSFKERLSYYLSRFSFSSFAQVAGPIFDGSQQCEQIKWSSDAS